MITVLITCKQCNTTDEKVTVRSRYENEHIKSYVDEVGRRIYQDHRNRHRRCTSLLDVKIPLNNHEKGIGY